MSKKIKRNTDEMSIRQAKILHLHVNFNKKRQIDCNMVTKILESGIPGLTGNILVGEWQITLLVHIKHVMECSCKSTLKICQLDFYLTNFTSAKSFPSFTVERKMFDCSKH